MSKKKVDLEKDETDADLGPRQPRRAENPLASCKNCNENGDIN